MTGHTHWKEIKHKSPLRHHKIHADKHGAFGANGFGARAESFARFFGTPKFLIGQTIIVAGWIFVNAIHLVRFDLYPFILLNLAFSLQAAYAAPLILLAQTRQADRDKATELADAKHREELSQLQLAELDKNTELTQTILSLSNEVNTLTKTIHQHLENS